MPAYFSLAGEEDYGEDDYVDGDCAWELSVAQRRHRRWGTM